MEGRQEKLFLEEKVWKSIFTMAIPAMITMIVMILYNMADIFFVGQLGDNNKVAAVSLIGPVLSLIMATGAMLGGGTCILIAKSFGEKNYEDGKKYASLCCVGSLIFGVVIAVVILVFHESILYFLGVEENTLIYARSYLLIVTMGSPVMIFSTSVGGIIRAEGAVKESMTGSILGAFSNIILDPIFILVFGMGVAGAAIATVLANALGALYYINYFRKGKSVNSISFAYGMKRPWEIFKIVSIGLPNAISTILSGFASVFANRFLVSYGSNAVAAMAAAGKATMVISMIQMGITMGVQPMIAYCFGAKNIERLKEIIKKLAILTVAIGVTMTILCFFNGKWIVSLFLQEGEALDLAQSMIHILILSGPMLGFYYLATSFLQASANATLATTVAVLRQGLLLIPLLYIMNQIFEIRGNIYAHVIADYIATLVSVGLAIYQYKKLVIQKEKVIHKEKVFQKEKVIGE